jgi:hypothetical protein
MKNLLTNFGKAFDPQRFLNLLKRAKRWDLLLIDDHGKVVSFQYVRALLVSFGIVNLILLSGLIYLYFLHTSSITKYSDLQNTLDTSLQESKALQQEVNALMIRLAEAQSKMSKRSVLKNTKPSKKSSESTKRRESAVIPVVDNRAEKQVNAAEEKSKGINLESVGKTPPDVSSAVRSQVVRNEKKVSVGVSDLFAFHDPELNALNVRFSIKNLGGMSSYASGYLFVILKEEGKDQKGWIPIPWVELVSGKPSQIKEGQYFKIRNYKTVEIWSGEVMGPKAFNKATLLAYSPSGELLLKKTFPIIINVPGISTEAAVLETEPPKPVKISPEPVEIEPVTAVEEGLGIQSDSEDIISNEVPEEDAGEDFVPPITE